MILIKGMEMPQNCEECIFSDVYSYPPHYDDEYICGINYASMSYEQAKKRHVDCPLIEVPEDVQPVVHGEWLEREQVADIQIDEWQSCRCSVCKKYHTTPFLYYFNNYNYCPNCGARNG